MKEKRMAKVCHQVGVVGAIDDIYRVLHQPAGLTGWWATTADGVPEVGGVLDLHFAGLATLSFRIEDLRENEGVCLRCVSGPGPWQECSLTFSLRQDRDQVWVRLDHENAAASEDDFLYFSTKWPCYLLSLKDLMETGQGRPYPNEAKIHLGD